ncbi:MAG: LysM peptidoglycan-binding domain-containing protein [Bacteroidota bacterium]|nr:LysM peptidoglycan-binding domain-containing protein [Bacteroidota bacterium]
MNKLFFLLIASAFFSYPLFAQYITVQQYVEDHKDIAIREMKRMGIPAAITLAQGILETENGNSDLVKKSNNHFGIKCKSSWTAEGVSHDDDAPGECFRVYKDAEESYRDHSNFLRGSTRYSFLFKLDPRDYKGWAYGLRKAGYATNPRYPDILIKNIEDNNLEQYSLMAAGEVPVFDATKYRDDPADNNNDVPDSSTGQNSEPETVISSQPGKLTINGSKALLAKKGTSLLAIATQNNINLAKLLEMNDLDNDGLLNRDQIIFLEKKQKEGDRDYYISQQNETLYDVAQKNGVQLESICAFNKLSKENYIYPGTKILLRAQAQKVSGASYHNEEISPNKKTIIHEVQPKEGLYTISKKYGVSVEQLKEWNSLQSDHLQIGQQLIISK